MWHMKGRSCQSSPALFLGLRAVAICVVRLQHYRDLTVTDRRLFCTGFKFAGRHDEHGLCTRCVFF